MPPLSNKLVLSVSVSFEHAESCLAASKGPLTPTPTPKETRKVTFNERVKAKKTIHIADFSEQEIEAYWYTNDEVKSMKKDVRFEANLLGNGCLAEESTRYCSRGLENFTSDGASRRIDNKKKVRTVVLEEQHLQREEGSCDHDYIAEIYTQAAASARSNARTLALQDESAVQ